MISKQKVQKVFEDTEGGFSPTINNFILKPLSITESPVISKFKPLVHSLRLKGSAGGIETKSTHGNNLSIGLDQDVQAFFNADIFANMLDQTR